MKKLFILWGLLLATQCLTAASQIQFEQSAWADVLSKAQTQQKLVFLDAYTSWCGPCKWMAKTAFTDPEVATYFNEHFVNVTIDMEKGEGPELAKQYNVTAYPTLLFIDGAGKMVHVAIGARAAADLLDLGKAVVEGKTVNLPALQARFDAGDRDPKFLHGCILDLARANMPYQDALEAYKEFMKGDALLQDDQWEIFKLLFRRDDTEFGQYFLTHRARFEEKFGKDVVREKALGLYDYRLYKVCEAKDEAGYKQLKADILATGYDSLDVHLLQIDQQWYGTVQDWKHFAKTVDALQAMGKADQYILNGAAWTFHEAGVNKKLLKKALAWVNASLEIERGSANLDTQAMVLHDLGRKDEAIAAAKESIALGKANDEDVSETEKALQEWLK